MRWAILSITVVLFLLYICLILYICLRPRRTVIFLKDGKRGNIQKDDVVVDVEFTEISSPLVNVYYRIAEGGAHVAEERCAMDARSGSILLFPGNSSYHDYPYVLTGQVSKKKDRIGVYLDKRA